MPSERGVVLGLAGEWAAAIVSNDPGQIARYMADDWVIVSGTGVTERAAFLALVASGDLTHQAMDTVEGTARVRVHGSVAVLTARVTNTAHYPGPTVRRRRVDDGRVSEVRRSLAVRVEPYQSRR